MLRFAIPDVAGDSPVAVSSSLVVRALGDLRSERMMSGGPGFAIEQFCVALLTDGPRAAHSYVDRLLHCGVSAEALYDTYIPRAAARLGELWLDDRLAFAGVTLGMARLTEVFRRLSPAFLRERQAPVGKAGRRALFALCPGDSHALGVVMAADYFQRAGWAVRVELMSDASQLRRIAQERAFDLIGLSAGSRRMIPDLRRTLDQLRAAAAPVTRFAVGGPVVALEPDIVGLSGADVAEASAPAVLAALERDA